MTALKPLFPYFGGKSRTAHKIWEHLGDVGSYVEPFFGSGAVLAARPHAVSRDTHSELVGDLNGWLVNAWRAVRRRPDLVYRYLLEVSYSEHDLRAAKKMVYGKDLSGELTEDFHFFDAELAACWLAVHGAFVGDTGQDNTKEGSLSTSGLRGVWRTGFSEHDLRAWSDRMRDLRILCGPWERCVSSPSRMDATRGIVGVYLDPPYADGSNTVYGAAHTDEPAIASARWAIDNGNDPNMRIIYSGYEGTVEFPDTWRIIEWETSGGYANKATKGDGAGKENAKRERLWLSPHCLDDRQQSLFGG